MNQQELNEQQWLDNQLANVNAYLREEEIAHQGEPKAVWLLAPYVVIWSVCITDEVIPDLWVISGDLPTDYLLDQPVANGHDALRMFVKRWNEAAKIMITGKCSPTLRIGDPNDADQQKELGELLAGRCKVLGDWCENEELWGM
jgi:hypothetical protein